MKKKALTKRSIKGPLICQDVNVSNCQINGPVYIIKTTNSYLTISDCNINCHKETYAAVNVWEMEDSILKQNIIHHYDQIQKFVNTIESLKELEVHIKDNPTLMALFITWSLLKINSNELLKEFQQDVLKELYPLIMKDIMD